MQNICYFCLKIRSMQRSGSNLKPLTVNNYITMFNHLVLFKLKDFPNDQLKSDIRVQIKDALLNLKGKIAELKEIEVGLNFELNAASFDISLITRFDSYEGFLVYRDHPEHQKVVGLVRANTVDRTVVDYND